MASTRNLSVRSHRAAHQSSAVLLLLLNFSLFLIFHLVNSLRSLPSQNRFVFFFKTSRSLLRNWRNRTYLLEIHRESNEAKSAGAFTIECRRKCRENVKLFCLIHSGIERETTCGMCHGPTRRLNFNHLLFWFRFILFWLSCRPRVYLLFGTIRDKYLRQKMTSTAVLYTATRPSTGTNENATSNTQPDYSREHSERLVSPELR